MTTSATARRTRAAAATGLMAAAAVAALLAPGAANAAPVNGHAIHAKTGPTSVVYVEVNDNDLSNVGHYTLADGSPAFDVAAIFAANIDYDGTKAQLFFNDRVQQTLDERTTQIRPLQKMGTKVVLSILGNHQGAGIANFPTQAAAQDFADQVAAAVHKYHLDGVDLDDEYSDYGVNGTPQPNQQSAGWLISALRAKLPNKIISLYDIGPAGSAVASTDPAVNAKLSYAWNPWYGSYSAPAVPGLDKRFISPAAVNLQSTPASLAASFAQRTISDGYGVFMTYDLRAGDESAYLSQFTVPLYGQAAVYTQ
jgi:hypothetical protein